MGKRARAQIQSTGGSGGGDSSASEQESEQDDGTMSDVDVQFRFNSFLAASPSSIRSLLTGALLSTSSDFLDKVADIVAEQAAGGCLIYATHPSEDSQEIPPQDQDPGDEDGYAVSMSTFIPLPSILVSHLLSLLPATATATSSKSKLTAEFLEKCSWLLNHRLINCPSEVVIPSFSILKEEFSLDAFENYAVLVKTYNIIESTTVKERHSKKIKGKGEAGVGEFYQYENEIFYQNASLKFKLKQSSERQSSYGEKKDAIFLDERIQTCTHLLILSRKELEASMLRIMERS